MNAPDTLARRRHALVARSQALREQMGDDSRVIETAVAQGLSLGRVGLGAAALMTGLLALRRRGAGRSRWRLLASGLKLLPLALGLWRSLQAARQATPRHDDDSPLPHADRSA